MTSSSPVFSAIILIIAIAFVSNALTLTLKA